VGLDNWCPLHRRGRDFYLYYHIQTGSGACLSFCLVILGDLSPGVKWPECDAAPSHPFTAKVKNAWSSTSTSFLFLWCGAYLSTWATWCFYIWYKPTFSSGLCDHAVIVNKVECFSKSDVKCLKKMWWKPVNGVRTSSQIYSWNKLIQVNEKHLIYSVCVWLSVTTLSII
jgi:hypothetical protein